MEEEKQSEITSVSPTRIQTEHFTHTQKNRLHISQELNYGENGTAVSDMPPSFQG